MKKATLIFIVACTLIAGGMPRRARAQSHEAQQLLLNVEKLEQLRQILQNMYKGYQILSQGYQKIKDITSGNFKLHQVFLDGLLLVNPELKKYRRIADIIQFQLDLLKEYKAAYRNFRESGQFTDREIDYLYKVYKGLMDESLQQLEELAMIITDSKLRMSDSERIEGVDRIFDSMSKKLAFVRDFNQQYSILALQRARSQKDISTSRILHDIK